MHVTDNFNSVLEISKTCLQLLIIIKTHRELTPRSKVILDELVSDQVSPQPQGVPAFIPVVVQRRENAPEHT